MSTRATHRFLESKHAHGNVVFNFGGHPIEDLPAFAIGYHMAGRRLAAHLNSSSGYADYEGYPILFLYRHALELYLKAIVYGGALLMGLISEQKIDTSQIFQRHELRRLVPAVRSIFKALEWDFKDTELTSFEDFAQLIDAIESVDPKSYAFRYPVTPDGEAQLPQHFVLNVVSFAHHMDGILELLGGAATGLCEELRMAAETRYELVQLFGTGGD